MLERQLIELNEDLQSLENDKNELHEQIDDLKEQLRSKDRQLQTIEVNLPDEISNAFRNDLEFYDHTWFSVVFVLFA